MGSSKSGYTGSTVNSRKLEHGLRMIRAGIPFSILLGHGDKDVPSLL